MDPKSIEVTFPTGRDVLNAYWGFLSNGGLVIDDRHGLREGDPVSLQVTIASSKQHYTLLGQVVRRPGFDAAAATKAVIEFQPGEPHDLMLSAAWAETDNVPARKHRRIPIDGTIAIRAPAGGGPELEARLLNISLGGCCVHLSSSGKRVATGEQVLLVAPGAQAQGVVRWSRAADLGVEFDKEGPTPFVRLFI